MSQNPEAAPKPAPASNTAGSAGAARPVIDRSDDPYPPSLHFRIRNFRYGDGNAVPPLGDHLQLIRYNARPKYADRTSDWQLSAGYSVWIDIDYRDDTGDGDRGVWRQETWLLTAPRAMYTDLSSIPAFARWIVSKTGPHLEASIIHDWLYLKWTDHRFDNKRFSDWVFADAVLAAGLKGLKDFHWFKKRVIIFAVQGAGWIFFFRKKMPLKLLLAWWETHLTDYPDNVPVPYDPKNYPPVSLGSRVYALVVLLFSLAIALLGLARLWTALTAWLYGGVPFWDSLFAWHTTGPGAATAAWIGQAAGFVILLVLGALGIALAAAVLVWAAGRTLVGIRRATGR